MSSIVLRIAKNVFENIETRRLVNTVFGPSKGTISCRHVNKEDPGLLVILFVIKIGSGRL